MNGKVKTILFNIAAILVLAGAILNMEFPDIAPYLFAIGAAGIAVCHLTTSTKEMDFRTRRLHRYNIFAGLLGVVASGLMFNQRKEWIICLTIAAILQLYTAFVTPNKQ
ncbi:hypothetical protein [Parabacteroides sp. AM08-6]|uniref:hypothetical protein n=1 Tax=Parabacteroides sp. AM08-6 TaxID=2292053 RepID=UPI000F005A0E|nr:hypothetical protein [Parabacteroides sp. AM08-6]RHJ77999.1 hypothetical protein DW103_15580 [Parabacteroides sp. AM08-6]